MTIKTELIGGEHILCGEWDDVVNNQFLVYYHPNGRDSIVFGFSGIDYGGGVSWVAHLPSELVDVIIDANPDAYEAKRRLQELSTP
jgi:hypothetical protein